MCVAINSPFTIGSHPTWYCHLVPSIIIDISFPFRSFLVGITDISFSETVIESSSVPIVIGILYEVPIDWESPTAPVSLWTFFWSIFSPKYLGMLSVYNESSEPVSRIAWGITKSPILQEIVATSLGSLILRKSISKGLGQFRLICAPWYSLMAWFKERSSVTLSQAMELSSFSGGGTML